MATKKALALVTGPSGFVGAHVFKQLLDSGYQVRGTIRSESKAKHLIDLFPAHKEDISFAIVPDIQSPGSLDDAMQDVDFVCHVASPYFVVSDDPWQELVLPAVEGTRNVMKSALKSTTLKRLIILSSFAAVVDVGKNPRPGYTYTDADWNPVSEEQARSNGSLGYAASKTFAERTAWEIWKEAKPAWDLVTLNPPMIYGPPIQDVDTSKGIEGLNTSLKLLMNGIMGRNPDFAPMVAKPGLPAWVDVRNVAQAHVNGLGLPQGTSGRFLLCGGVDYFEDGLTHLRDLGERGLGAPGEKCDANNHFSLDTSKAKKILHIDFIPFQTTVEDVWLRMKTLGIVSRGVAVNGA